MRAFEALHPADGLRFEIRSEIPLARGLGSSAAAIVAGLMAADHLFELALDRDEIYARAVELEGHPGQRRRRALRRLRRLPARRSRDARPPPGQARASARASRASWWSPRTRCRPSGRGRRMPADVPMDDAVANVAAASQLVLGIERSDLTLIARGLADRLHQPHRAHLYPRSMELLAHAARARRDRGDRLRSRAALLFWCFWQDTGKVTEALRERVARLGRACSGRPFSPWRGRPGA